MLKVRTSESHGPSTNHEPLRILHRGLRGAGHAHGGEIARDFVRVIGEPKHLLGNATGIITITFHNVVLILFC